MHPLDGPRLKIARASQEIDCLHKAESDFFKEAEYAVVPAEVNSKTGQQVYRVHAPLAPPEEWGVTIGEIAHNLRSALDGLVYQLAVLKGHETPTGTQFPIFMAGRPRGCKGKCQGRARRFHFQCRGRDMIRLLDPVHQALIERLQPYKRSGSRRLNYLYILSEINNADKHRLIQITGPKLRNLSFKMTVSDTVVGLPPLNPRLIVLEHGAKVMEAGPHVHVNPEIVSRVAFWKGCAAVKYLPVHETLIGCLRRVSYIIEGFAPAWTGYTVKG